ncbi:MAG: undecaprenyl-diphosphate phosphatase [Candidatus Omnitrophota bacterium]|nr:MAG: undecaprenyl-diphosphate phosphatase [Candidatus Omnitrophota bacterium]
MKFLFLGLIQGLTEFLPISSSGHLYLAKRLLELKENLLSYFVLLHIATLLAILIMLSKRVKVAIKDKRLLGHLAVITVITAAMGWGIRNLLFASFNGKFLVAFCFLINGIILLSIKNGLHRRTSNDMRLRDSLVLGLVQGFAIFPGISRSGITISSLLRRGFKREEAFYISFLMAIPILVIAFLSECKGLFSVAISPAYIAGGFFIAFISGIIALRIVKHTVVSARFKNFGYYSLVIFLVSLFL